MIKSDKYWRIIPVSLLGLYVNYKLIRDADVVFILDELILGAIMVVFAIILIWTIITDFKDYTFSSLKLSFLPAPAYFLFYLFS